jgi:hypothetical protein
LTSIILQIWVKTHKLNSLETKEGPFGNNLCAQILFDPHQGDPKNNTFLELDKIMYSLVVSIHPEHPQVDQNLLWKTILQQGKLTDYPCSKDYNFLVRTRITASSMPLESRHCELFKNIKISKIQHWELNQTKAGKTAKVRINARNLSIMAICHTTFVHKFLGIHTKVIQKANTFSKKARFSTTWSSRFAISIS